MLPVYNTPWYKKKEGPPGGAPCLDVHEKRKKRVFMHIGVAPGGFPLVAAAALCVLNSWYKDNGNFWTMQE